MTYYVWVSEQIYTIHKYTGRQVLGTPEYSEAISSAAE